jgi:regulator of sirC expression with transglutaminase-like and TPR domain
VKRALSIAVPAALMVVIGACSEARRLPLTAALLELAANAGEDVQPAEAALDELVRVVRRVRAKQPQLPVGVLLQQVVFDQLGFTREVTDTSLRFVLLPGVLEQRRGSCVGLGTLYLALGERLGYQLRGVLMPGHFYVRLEDRGAHHNLELLRGGEEMPEAWYRTRFPVPGEHAAEYARELTNDEVVGVVAFDIGNARKQAGKLVAAGDAYERARRRFPALAEAHASAGAVSQLLGELERARAAYRAAQLANPHLPGVERNLALLDEELAQKR